MCIGTASFSVQVNGELAVFFRSERGLRQGCSLSPYLFVICMNVLSCLLDRAALERRIGYHPRCRNMSLTHLCFADDIMVFSDGRSSSIEGILTTFEKFAVMSGLKISLEKSTVFMAGISQTDKDIILQQFPFEAGTLPVKNSLWVQWIYKNLIRKGTLWSVKEKSSLGSWIWKKILKYRDKAQRFHKMEVRSGESTSFWFDVWSPFGNLYQLLGSRGIIDMGIAEHDTVSKVMNSHRRRRHRVDILNQVENQIELARQGRRNETDRSLWKNKDDSFKCNFSSQSTWQQIRQITPRCEWYKGIWFPYSTPKYSFVTWLAFHNRLATGDRLRKWNMGTRDGCVFCGEELETRDHLFFSCPYSSQIWSSLTRGFLHNRYTTSWSSITPLLLDNSQSPLCTFTLRYVFQLSIHSLWRERNGRRHGDSAVPASKLTKIIDKNVRNRFSTIKQRGNSIYDEGLQFWFHTRTSANA